ncbi:globin [Aureibacillus halotolerans]|uniref:Hemoglobin n=1 Tax=Aureibacillus halotolerans TaxID=1508390 RepID=A0A4R6U6L4_9BACI|nr:globin [Aureibacillus halotolerans]TDQ42140.1 hemoglobin [Aureibacillus halotolerans]
MTKQPSPYDMIGGENVVKDLVEKFYQRVSSHPELSPIFPEDLTETRRKQVQFMTQFLGGPSLYTEEHGHPRLRARHLPFQITPSRAQAWLECMQLALSETEADEHEKRMLFERLKHTAQHMINTPQDRE